MNDVQLAKAVGSTVDRATLWLAHLEAAMAEFGIDTKQRQAMFLAQIGHESGGLRYTVEVWQPTAAQLTYEGRKGLGNTVAGDGYKFRGRGLIQITGRFNYTEVGKALGLDCVNDPDLLSDPVNGARSAAWWWHSRRLNAYADADDCKGCTKVINGGFNGLDDRLARYEAAKSALPDVVAPVPAVRGIVGFLSFVFKIVTSLMGKKG